MNNQYNLLCSLLELGNDTAQQIAQKVAESLLGQTEPSLKDLHIKMLLTAVTDTMGFNGTVYVPEMGVRPALKKEAAEQLVDAEDEVSKFVADEKLKVMLVQGGAGSGKSLFCHMFAKRLFEEKKLDYIPVFINLPSLKDPVIQVLEETLKN